MSKPVNKFKCSYLFYETEGKINKSCIIEGIDSYLSDKLVLTYNNQMAVKFKLDLSIKIDTSDIIDVSFASTFNSISPAFDYAKLILISWIDTYNDDGEIISSTEEKEVESCFYYVVDKRILAKNTLQLDLHMDVLNSLCKTDMTPLHLNEKTLVTREHKDRFYDNSYFEAGDSDSKNVDLVRKFSLTPEGLNPTLYKNQIDKFSLIDKGYSGVIAGDQDGEWYLVYRSNADITTEGANLDNPVDIFLLPSIAQELNYQHDNNYDATDFNPSKYWYYITSGSVGNISVSDRFSFSGGISCCYGILWHIQASNLIIYYLCYNTDNPEEIRIINRNSPLTSSGEKIVANYIYGYGTSTISLDEASEHVFEAYNEPKVSEIYITNTPTNVQLKGINDLDRTDSKLIKIICLPYAPADNDFTGWTYDSIEMMFKCNSPSTRFGCDLHQVDWPLDSFRLLNAQKGNINSLGDRDVTDLTESQAFHSEFFIPKLYYDSFSMPLKFEEFGNISTNINKIEFDVTKTINSKFLFKIPLNLEQSKSDYPLLMMVQRNNEAQIYTSNYLNYLRTAYRYDLKNHTYELEKQYINAAAKVSKDLSKGDILGGFGTLLESGASMYFNNLQWQNQMDSSIAQLKEQAVNVSGSDDLDLMRLGVGNYLHFDLYKPSEHYWEMLMDLFYYYGCKTLEIKVPDWNSRYWFNYVEFAPVLDQNMPDEFRNEIIEKCKAGVTIFHKHGTTWDIEQNKENWETWLVSQAQL